MRIKFGEIKVEDASLKHISDCISSNHVTMGPKTKLLESTWSNLLNCKHTIAVSSGTSACMAANMALYDFGAKPGDEVIVPALSFIATANSVRAAGLVPVFCDVKNDLLINEELIEGLITPRTRAIMPVSLMGKPPKMDVIYKIADKHGLLIICDNCEGHMCQYQGRYMENWADVVVYSCYAAHILFSCEMGLVSTNNPLMANVVESIRSHGREPGSLYFNHLRYGLNLKPTDLHASIGLGSVEKFQSIYNQRKKNWLFLKDRLSNFSDLFFLSDEDEGSETSPHGFSIVVKPGTKVSRNGLVQQFDKDEIDWKRNFGSMPTQHDCFSYLGHKLGDFPKAEYIGDNGIHVGVHQFLTENDLNTIVNSVTAYVESVTK